MSTVQVTAIASATDLLAMRLPMTRHGKARSRQRAITALEIDLLRTFGASEKAHDGCTKYFLDKPAKRRVAAYAGKFTATEALAHRYIVVGPEDQLITVGHRCERIRRSS